MTTATGHGGPGCCGDAAVQGRVVPQNDIADLFRWLIEWFEKIAEFFDALNAPRRQLGGCEEAAIEAIRTDVVAAATALLNSVPGHLERYLQCRFGGAATQAINRQAIVACVVSAAWSYFQTRDRAATIAQLVTCLMGAGGTPTPMPPVTPVPPAPPVNPPVAGNFLPVKRC